MSADRSGTQSPGRGNRSGGVAVGQDSSPGWTPRRERPPGHVAGCGFESRRISVNEQNGNTSSGVQAYWRRRASRRSRVLFAAVCALPIARIRPRPVSWRPTAASETVPVEVVSWRRRIAARVLTPEDQPHALIVLISKLSVLDRRFAHATRKFKRSRNLQRPLAPLRLPIDRPPGCRRPPANRQGKSATRVRRRRDKLPLVFTNADLGGEALHQLGVARLNRGKRRPVVRGREHFVPL